MNEAMVRENFLIRIKYKLIWKSTDRIADHGLAKQVVIRATF